MPRKIKKNRSKKRRISTRRIKNNSQLFLFVGFFLVLAIGIILFLYKNFAEDTSIKPETANPASVNCVKKGGVIKTKQNVDGSQYTLCRFSDGRECEEWVLFTDNICKPR